MQFFCDGLSTRWIKIYYRFIDELVHVSEQNVSPISKNRICSIDMTKAWFKIIEHLLFIKVNRTVNMALKFSCYLGINVACRKVEGITCQEERRILDHYENQIIRPHGA